MIYDIYQMDYIPMNALSAGQVRVEEAAIAQAEREFVAARAEQRAKAAVRRGLFFSGDPRGSVWLVEMEWHKKR